MSGSTQRRSSALKLGPVTITSGAEIPNRMAILLWGLAAAGKTTFSATAPGKKLWLSFGDQEHVPVMHRKDVMVANFSDLGHAELFKHAQSDNPFGLDQILAENNEIETVVCDSLTAIAYRALQKAVGERVGAGNNFSPTMMTPGISAYGGRNAIVLETLTGLLRVTGKHGVHFIGTAHEDDPQTTKDNKGNDLIDYITIMLGGKLVNNMTWRWSEIWHLSQSLTGDKERMLAIRNTRRRRPMKTRMFTNLGEPEFTLHYDADRPDKGQMTIQSWYDQWAAGGFQKLAVPEQRRKK